VLVFVLASAVLLLAVSAPSLWEARTRPGNDSVAARLAECTGRWAWSLC
jgi:hypothetical protein